MTTVLKTIAIAVTAIFALGACSTGTDESPTSATQPDYVQWEADLAAYTGQPVVNFGAVKRIYENDFCQQSDDDFKLLIAVNTDAGTLEEQRISTEHACPDKLPLFDEVASTTSKFDRICTYGPENESEARLAEAVGC